MVSRFRRSLTFDKKLKFQSGFQVRQHSTCRWSAKPWISWGGCSLNVTIRIRLNSIPMFLSAYSVVPHVNKSFASAKFVGTKLPNQCNRLPWNWRWHDPIRCKLPWLCRGGTSRCFLEGAQNQIIWKFTLQSKHLGTIIAFDGYYYYPKATVIARWINLVVLFGFQWNVHWNVLNLILFDFHLKSWKRYAEDLGCLPAVPWPTFMDGVQANAAISKATQISRKQDSSLS